MLFDQNIGCESATGRLDESSMYILRHDLGPSNGRTHAGSATSDATIQAVYRCAQRIDVTPLVVDQKARVSYLTAFGAQ